MYFHKKIKNLRDKPQHVKEGILIVVMAVSVSIIITVWFLNFNFSVHPQEIGTFVDNTKNYFSDSDLSLFDRQTIYELEKKGYDGKLVRAEIERENRLGFNSDFSDTSSSSIVVSTTTEIQTATNTIVSTGTDVRVSTNTKVK